jgi:hypothetical protein
LHGGWNTTDWIDLSEEEEEEEEEEVMTLVARIRAEVQSGC